MEDAVTLGNEIHAAIARRDSMAVRQMASVTKDQEAQMFLVLLADIIDKHQKRGLQLEKKGSLSGSSQHCGQLTAA